MTVVVAWMVLFVVGGAGVVVEAEAEAEPGPEVEVEAEVDNAVRVGEEVGDVPVFEMAGVARVDLAVIGGEVDDVIAGVNAVGVVGAVAVAYAVVVAF